MDARRIALMGCLATIAVPCRARAAWGGDRAGPYALELVDGSGNELPTYRRSGRTYVLGERGARYALRIENHSGRRVEFVVSVDGRDVLDGRPSSWRKGGYVVGPYDRVVIEGFRLSGAAVAAFRFGSVADSYAAKMGDARDVGVIGVAVFPEKPAWPEVEPPPSEVAGEDRVPLVPGPGATGGAGPIDEQRAPAPNRPGREAARCLHRFPAPASAAPSPVSHPAASLAAGKVAALERPGLATEFGERRTSYAESVTFDRQSSRPAAVLSVRYDDREGLLALGIDVDGWRLRRDLGLRETADPFRRDPGFSQPPPGWSGRR